MRRESYIHPKIAELVKQPLEPEEFERRVAALTEEDVEENLALIRWFKRRYPTARDRLAYASRNYQEWTHPAKILPR